MAIWLLTKVFVDNKSAIQVVKHPEHQSTMKHVHRAFHWIRSCVENGDLEVFHVAGMVEEVTALLGEGELITCRRAGHSEQREEP